MKERLKELEKKAQRAIARAVASERRLYGPGGVPASDWERHQEQLRGIRAERNAILAAIERERAQIEREQLALREQINDSLSPSDALEPYERAEGERMLSFAEREIRTLSPVRIKARLESLAASGSRVEKFAWTVAAAGYEREVLARRRGAREPGGPGPRAGAQPASTAFSNALDELQVALLDPVFKARVAPVQEALDLAEGLAKLCFTGARDATSYASAYRNANSAIRPIVERQKFDRGGRPPAPPTEPPSREEHIAS